VQFWRDSPRVQAQQAAETGQLNQTFYYPCGDRPAAPMEARSMTPTDCELPAWKEDEVGS